MADIPDPTQTQPMAGSPPVEPPPVPLVSEIPVADSLVVPAIEEVKPPEPPKTDTPPKEDKPKKQIKPSVLITGLLVMLITLPLIAIATKNTLNLFGYACSKDDDFACRHENKDPTKPVETAPVKKEKETSGTTDTATKKVGCKTAKCFDGNEPVPVDPVRLEIVYKVYDTLKATHSEPKYDPLTDIRKPEDQAKIDAATKLLKDQNVTKPTDQQTKDAIAKTDAAIKLLKQLNVPNITAQEIQLMFAKMDLGITSNLVVPDQLTVTLECGRFSGNARALCYENNAVAQTQCSGNNFCTSVPTLVTYIPENVAGAIALATCDKGNASCIADVKNIILTDIKNQGITVFTPSNIPVGGTCNPASGISGGCAEGLGCSCTGAGCTCGLTGGQAPCYHTICPSDWSCSGSGSSAFCTEPGGKTNPPGDGGGGSNPPQCVNIIAFKGTTPLTSSDLAALHPGDQIGFAYAPGGSPTKVRFRVTAGTTTGDWNEVTSKTTVAGTSYYGWAYTVENATSFSVEAQWFDGTNWH